jgi:hypothetical protein
MGRPPHRPSPLLALRGRDRLVTQGLSDGVELLVRVAVGGAGPGLDVLEQAVRLLVAGAGLGLNIETLV